MWCVQTLHCPSHCCMTAPHRINQELCSASHPLLCGTVCYSVPWYDDVRCAGRHLYVSAAGLPASAYLAPSGCDPFAPGADLLRCEPKPLRLLCCTVDCVVQLIHLNTGTHRCHHNKPSCQQLLEGQTLLKLCRSCQAHTVCTIPMSSKGVGLQ
jgi:hypothetical protein